jgi:hypothetical protein
VEVQINDFQGGIDGFRGVVKVHVVKGVGDWDIKKDHKRVQKKGRLLSLRGCRIFN